MSRANSYYGGYSPFAERGRPQDRRHFRDTKLERKLTEAAERKSKASRMMQPQKQFSPKPPKPPKGPSVTTVDPSAERPKVSVSTLIRTFGRTVAPLAAAALSPTRAADAELVAGAELMPSNTIDSNPINRNVIRTPELRALDVGYVDQALPKVEWDRPVNFDAPTLPQLPELKPEKFKVSDQPSYTRYGNSVEIKLPDVWLEPPIVMDPVPELFPDWDIRTTPMPEIFWPVDYWTPEIELKAPARGRIKLDEPTVVVDVKVEPHAKTKEETVSVRIRRTRVRTSQKRRKETKAHSRWIKAAYKLINSTYGTYTEVQDFLESLAYNLYAIKDGKRISALAMEDGSLLNVVKGYAEGKYELDIGSFIIDFAVMQASDMVIGKINQKVVQDWIDTGVWQHAEGPAGFISGMQKELKNVSSLYTPN